MSNEHERQEQRDHATHDRRTFLAGAMAAVPLMAGMLRWPKSGSQALCDGSAAALIAAA